MNTSLFDRAAKFAIDAHANVSRKGKNIPYILHPMEAAMITSSMTDDQELIAAAILHDVVEDTDITIEEIRREFGDHVADIVAHETVLDEEPGYELTADERDAIRTGSWRNRKLLTIRRVQEGSMETKIVAMGDKLSNLRAINRDYEKLGNELWKRFRTQDPKDHEWYYRSLGEALRDLADTEAYREYMYLLHRTFSKMPPKEQMSFADVLGKTEDTE